MDAKVETRDCLSAKWNFEHAFADPSRRAGGKRSLNPDDFLPSIGELAPRMTRLVSGLIKLSPMLSNEFLASIGGRIEFWSYRGECREALIFLGQGSSMADESKGPSFAARHVETGSVLPFGRVNEPSKDAPGALFFEADPAAIRAGSVGSLSMLAGIQPLGDSNGYLTSDAPENPQWSMWLKKYKVMAFGHADEKAIKSDLKKLDAKIEAVKVRGAKEDAIAWSKKLNSLGERPVALALYPVGRSLRYVLLEPMQTPGKNT